MSPTLHVHLCACHMHPCSSYCMCMHEYHGEQSPMLDKGQGVSYQNQSIALLAGECYSLFILSVI